MIELSEELKIAYRIRELYRGSSWPKPKDLQESQICRKIKLKSLGFDVGLILDGSLSLPFNYGTEALFEVRSEDALKTVILT